MPAKPEPRCDYCRIDFEGLHAPNCPTAAGGDRLARRIPDFGSHARLRRIQMRKEHR